MSHGLTAAELTAAWAQLTNGPGEWLKHNLLIISGGSNSPEPTQVKYWLTGEKLPGSATRKYKLLTYQPQPQISIQVSAHRFALIGGPPTRHSPTGHEKLHLAAQALTNNPGQHALAVTGQLSGCVVALAAGASHTLATHVQPSNGYKIPDGATALQNDVTHFGELDPAQASGERAHDVTMTFGRNEYPHYATVLGQFLGGRWVFFAQRFDAVNSPGPYHVASFAADTHVHDV